MDGNFNLGGNIQSGSGGIPIFEAPADGSDNTAAGWGALQSVAYSSTTGYGSANTAAGVHALYNNTIGSSNTAVGSAALEANQTTPNNTAVGIGSLRNYTTGIGGNTAIGEQALQSITTGASNTALGSGAGANLVSGSNNIHIVNQGTASDNAVIRIGDIQTSTFIAGIRGVTTGMNNALPVVIDSNGQLGTASGGGSNATTVNGASVPANATFTGTNGSSQLTALTPGQATAAIAAASGGGTTNFLRADGTWAEPPSGGGGSPVDHERVEYLLHLRQRWHRHDDSKSKAGGEWHCPGGRQYQLERNDLLWQQRSSDISGAGGQLDQLRRWIRRATVRYAKQWNGSR